MTAEPSTPDNWRDGVRPEDLAHGERVWEYHREPATPAADEPTNRK